MNHIFVTHLKSALVCNGMYVCPDYLNIQMHTEIGAPVI